MENNKNISFEQSLDELKVIVTKLENGETTLNDSMDLFQRGTELIKNCNSILDEAEQKVVKLIKGDNGNPEEVPFEDNND